MTTEYSWEFKAEPKTVGYWRLSPNKPFVQLYLQRRPRWLTRVAMKLVFEIEWFDEVAS